MREGEFDNPGEAQVMHAMSVDDAYRVERVLSRGNGGVTECVSIEGAGPFVRKRIPRDRARRGVWALVADCRSPYLPRVRATYEMPDWFVVVYDFVPGETLERRVSRGGRLSFPEAAAFMRTLCLAVEELHAHGIVHRDLTPANVVLSSDGAHLIDFDIARMVNDASSCKEEPLGTWGFAAPEQYGFAETDARSDVYSLGRLLGFALAGVRPDDERFERILDDGSLVRADVLAVVRRACAFEPSARYQTAAEFAAALAAVEESPVLPAERSEAGTESPRATSGRARARRVRKAAVVAFAVACCVLAAVGLASVAGGGAPGEPGPDSSGALSEGQGGNGDGAESARAEGAGVVGDAVPTAAEGPVLDVAEEGWSVDDAGFVNYAFALRNGDVERTVLFPTVRIIGRDEAGAVLFASDQTLMALAPGRTLYFAGVVGDGTAPASVEFEPVEPAEGDVVADGGVPPEFAVERLKEVPDGFGGSRFTGEVRLVGGEMPQDSTGVAVTVLLRDAAGAIVYGTTAFADAPAEGSPVPFDAPAFDVPPHESVEAHVQAW